MLAIGYGVLLVGVSLSTPPRVAGKAGSEGVRPGPLLAQTENFVGRPVEVDIVEALIGPASAELLARAEYGQVRIAIRDFGSAELSLVPAGFRLEDPDRYRLRFGRVLAPPLRVRG